MNIFQKILLIFLLVVIFPISLFGFFIVRRFYDSAIKGAYSCHAFLSILVAWQVDAYLGKGEIVLQGLAQRNETQSFNLTAIKEILDRADKKVINSGERQADPLLESVYVIDKEGKLLAAYPEQNEVIGRDFSEDEVFAGVKARGNTFFSEKVDFSRVNLIPVVEMGVPIINSAGEVEGVLKAEINIRNIDLITRSAITGKTGIFFIITEKGEVVSSPKKSISFRHNIDEIMPGFTEQMKRNTNGSQAFLYPKEKATSFISHWPAQKVSWTIVLERDVLEALSLALAMKRQFIIILVSTAFFAFVLIFYLSHGIVTPLTALTKRIKDIIEKEDLETEVKISQRNEIGKLAECFNQMIYKLKQKTGEWEEARSVLEIKVAARTRELAELNKGLEGKVQKRTEDLQAKINELDKWHKLTVRRELKMVELKEKIEGLERQLKEKE